MLNTEYCTYKYDVMAKKNNYKSTVNEEHYAVCFRDDALHDPNIKVGVMIAIEYYNGWFSLVRVNWGPEEEWECPMDGAVEQHWLFCEEETKKLMQLTDASNGKELIRAIHDRFRDNACEADYAIIEWCKEERVEYFFGYYRELTKRTKRMLVEMRYEKSEN